jgi:hypothetical protein
VSDASKCYLCQRSDGERRMVDDLVGRSRSRATRALHADE